MKSARTILALLLVAGCTAPADRTEPPARSSDARTPGAAATEAMPDMDAMQDMGGMNMAAGPIRVTTRQTALAGVTFAIAREAAAERTVRAVATAVPDERRVGIVNARVAGWVEKLHVNETGRLVRAGEPLFELYSPDLLTVQEEFLLARRLGHVSGGDSLIASARRRLELWGISEPEIERLATTGEVSRRLVIRSPFAGNVLEKNVIEGQMVRPGDRLYRIADLSTIWIEPAIFEQDIARIRIGQRAEVRFDARPGAVHTGRVTFIHPELDAATRTLRVRVELNNPGFTIRPMMYGTTSIRTTGPVGVVVPLAAVLPTGEQDLAFRVRDGGVHPTPVTVNSYGDSTAVLAAGLTAGDTVVASATFLFDSESSLAAAMAGIMLDMGMGLDMGGMQMEGMDMPGMDMSPPTADSGASRDSQRGGSGS